MSYRVIKVAAVSSAAMLAQFAAAHPGHAEPGLLHNAEHALWLMAGAAICLAAGLLVTANRRRR